ncbi:hypothetical protein OSB04_023805 [Centaurea solstitialis]|uniref:Disease resistance RPP13-like protein 1 n=1 Tax=Centaurea solstitialis TaxID=347529 RepID=A0AA38SSG4_9ASTR|nr:hypothetical protein OSB04_023805 [Centaurea solstitialis]
MVVAEIFLASFITVLFDTLASADLIKLARSAGIYSELDKWKITLTQIQAVLVDVGQKHITQIAVQQWLNTLHHLAYDIDDLLDDLVTEALWRQMNKGSDTSTSTNKVMKIIPSLDAFTLRNLRYTRKMSSKLEDITTKLHQLVEQKNLLLLVENVERSTRTNRRLEETSLVDESRIVGMEKDKEALLSKLLENESNNRNFSVVSIVGLGGIEKTTLAQAVYNNKKVEDYFELKAWVCVSDEFDVFTISKAILQAVGGDNQSFANLNLLQVALREKLLKKRFLLVLDDLWNKNYDQWELLQRPFLVGAPGSKVMVTTRNATVTTVMDFVRAYHLEVLSDEEALSLFAEHALGEQNFDKHPMLKLHGEGIMKKCDGLPLALRTLGRVLRTKTNVDEWEGLLNSEIWNLHNESKILPALRLSYYDLPSHLKQLFAYCCLFPKDYMFNKDDLVQLWMAEGFLHESHPSKSMESFGREYFEELVSRLFFQHPTDDISRYAMHDLINDLATSVGGDFFFRLDDKMGNEAWEKVHHFSYIPQEYGLYKKFKALQRARRLRTFLSVATYEWQRFYLSSKVLVELLPHLQFLRVLNLSNHSIREVPQSIGGLKHIRYINFSQTRITCLPDQVSDLYNLQSLLLHGCDRLSNLPDTFAKLTNLRHLDICDTPLLNKIPLGLGGLISLQTLSKVIIERDDGFKISDLKVLLHLRGELYIKGLDNVKDGIEAKEANLQQKKDLDDLVMEWRDDSNDSRNKMDEYVVLEGLRPHCKLRNLKILFYGGMKSPSWVGDSVFDQLTELTLRGCRSCTYLPTLGHLQALRKLFVASMNELKTLGTEFLASPNSFHCIAFPSLEVLYARNSTEVQSKLCSKACLDTFKKYRENTQGMCDKLKRLEQDKREYILIVENFEEKIKAYQANELQHYYDTNYWKWEKNEYERKLTKSRDELEKVRSELEKAKSDLEKFSKASKAMDALLKSQVHDDLKRGIRYNATLPPYNNNYIPPTIDLLEKHVDEEMPKRSLETDPPDKVDVEKDESESKSKKVKPSKKKKKGQRKTSVENPFNVAKQTLTPIIMTKYSSHTIPNSVDPKNSKLKEFTYVDANRKLKTTSAWVPQKGKDQISKSAETDMMRSRVKGEFERGDCWVFAGYHCWLPLLVTTASYYCSSEIRKEDYLKKKIRKGSCLKCYSATSLISWFLFFLVTNFDPDRVSSSIVRLTMCDMKGLTQLHEDVLTHLWKVEDLCITSCDGLRYLWELESVE